MTKKRFTTIESGIDYGVIDNTTDDRIFDVDITTKLNELSDENEQLKQQVSELKKENEHFQKVFGNKYEVYIDGIIGGNVNEL